MRTVSFVRAETVFMCKAPLSGDIIMITERSVARLPDKINHNRKAGGSEIFSVSGGVTASRGEFFVDKRRLNCYIFSSNSRAAAI